MVWISNLARRISVNFRILQNRKVSLLNTPESTNYHFWRNCFHAREAKHHQNIPRKSLTSRFPRIFCYLGWNVTLMQILSWWVEQLNLTKEVQKKQSHVWVYHIFCRETGKLSHLPHLNFRTRKVNILVFQFSEKLETIT